MRLKQVFPVLTLCALFAVSTNPIQAQKTVSARPLIVEHVDEAQLTTLSGNTRPEARAAYDRGAVSADLPMPGMILVLRRPAETEAAVEAYAESQQDTSSPNYHHWLTAEEQGEKFGPAPSDIDTITSWLQNHGFSIDSIAKNRMTIEFSGTAAQVQSAFHTEIHNLNVKGESHIANMSNPQIPSALATAVVGMQALHNFHARPLHRLGAQVQRNSQTGKWQRISAPAAPAQSQTIPAAGSKIVDLPLFNTGGTDSTGAAEIEDIAPYDLATIYNILPLWNASTPIDGTGQKIAIVGTSDVNAADVAAFRKAFGLPALATSGAMSFTTLHPNTAPGNCPNADNSCINDLIENSLDVEWSGAVAKSASIILVASSSGSGSDYTSDPVYISSKYIIDNQIAPVMNVSYGECELGLGQAGNSAYNALWQSASMAGISVFVASGDEGSASCDAGYDTSVPYGAQFGLSVSGVASTPYNTAVGGTDFNWGWVTGGQTTYWNTTNNSTTLASAKGYIPESPWNNTCSNSLLDADINSQLKASDSAATLCNDIGTAKIEFGTPPAPEYALIDVSGGSGGKSSCTTYSGDDPGSCTGGYAKPSWQANVTGIPADSKRDIPDVSFFAANGFSGSAYVICATASGFPGACSYTAGAEPSYEEVGGTSVASPVMAGVMALINQKTGTAQGLPNKVLYGLAAKETYSSCTTETVTNSSSCAFNDIDKGTIAMPCDANSLNCDLDATTDTYGILSGYDAGTGYDLATGLGSLNVANAVNAFATAVAPAVSLSTTSLTFTGTAVGTATATQTVTVTNSGTDPLVISNVSISGTNASAFSETDTCSTASVAGGKTCTISVIFTPTAIGSASASLSITDNAANSPQSVSLAGTLAEPAGSSYTLSAAAVTIATAGTSGTSAITATGAGGYVGPSTVTLSSCTLATSPAGAASLPTCSLTTPSVTFASGSSSGSGGVVTIGTTAAVSNARKAALAANHPSSNPWSTVTTAAGSITLAGLLFFLPGRTRRRRALLGAFLLIASIGFLSGCGNSNSSTITCTACNAGTTAGSYTFTITGKDSAGTTQTATLNLTVN